VPAVLGTKARRAHSCIPPLRLMLEPTFARRRAAVPADPAAFGLRSRGHSHSYRGVSDGRRPLPERGRYGTRSSATSFSMQLTTDKGRVHRGL
jgi:hypothetical protein